MLISFFLALACVTDLSVGRLDFLILNVFHYEVVWFYVSAGHEGASAGDLIHQGLEIQ